MAKTPGKQTITLMGAEVRRDANESSAHDRCSATDYIPSLIKRCKSTHEKTLRKTGRWPAGVTKECWFIRLPSFSYHNNGLNSYMMDSKQRVLAFEYINDAADFLDDHHRSIAAEAASADYIFCFPNDDKEARSGQIHAAASHKLSLTLTTAAQADAGSRCAATGEPFSVGRQQILSQQTGRVTRFGCMSSLYGYKQIHSLEARQRTKRKSEEQLTPEDSSASNVQHYQYGRILCSFMWRPTRVIRQ